jgi:hypothetical protein
MLRSYPEAAAATRIGTIVCMVAVSIVLVLPALRTYHFARSYKPVEAQSAVRHWSLDLNEERAVSAIDQVAESPSFTGLVPALIPTVTGPNATLVPPTISIPHLLRRLRLGSGRAPDLPLLG